MLLRASVQLEDHTKWWDPEYNIRLYQTTIESYIVISIVYIRDISDPRSPSLQPYESEPVS